MSVPRPAATILLLRQQQEEDIEVLMVRRHANLSFMADTWVFPGGALHATDTAEAALQLLDVETIAARIAMCDAHGKRLAPDVSAGLVFAACRETFEETGVLLARDHSGNFPDRSALERVSARRQSVLDDAGLFAEVLRAEHLRPDLDGLAYWAHWITPSSVAKRFDTRFFIIRAPDEQTASADASETVESIWMTPAALLEAARRKEMPVSHPTQCNLHDLQVTLTRYASLDDLLAGEAQRIVQPIQPKMVSEQDHMVIVMPWDADYAGAPGEGIASTDAGPLRTLPSRVAVRR